MKLKGNQNMKKASEKFDELVPLDNLVVSAVIGAPCVGVKETTQRVATQILRRVSNDIINEAVIELTAP